MFRVSKEIYLFHTKGVNGERIFPEPKKYSNFFKTTICNVILRVGSIKKIIKFRFELPSMQKVNIS